MEQGGAGTKFFFTMRIVSNSREQFSTSQENSCPDTVQNRHAFTAF